MTDKQIITTIVTGCGILLLVGGYAAVRMASRDDTVTSSGVISTSFPSTKPIAKTVSPGVGTQQAVKLPTTTPSLKTAEQSEIDRLRLENERLRALATPKPTPSERSDADEVRSFEAFAQLFLSELQPRSDVEDKLTPGVSRKYSNFSTDIRRTDSLKSPLVGVVKFDLFEDVNQPQGAQWAMGYRCVVEFNITSGRRYEILSAWQDVTQRIPPSAGTALGTGDHQDMLAFGSIKTLLEECSRAANSGVNRN